MEELLVMDPGQLDILGLDFYAHSQWEFHTTDGQGTTSPTHPHPLAAVMVEYAKRYKLRLSIRLAPRTLL